MSRRPEQVHVFLYRRNCDGEYEFAVFQREDAHKCWQGVCGGVEEGESAEQAARREAFEEVGITETLPLYRLDTMSYLPSNIFHAATEWGMDVVVVPMYFFAAPFEGEVRLSHEHTEVRWLKYKPAEDIIYYHDQKVALWELNERLTRNNLVR